MRALLSIVAIAALAAAAPGRPVTACDTLKTACSDLYRSIECGTLENCIPYWERLKTPVGNDTELCATCKEMVQEARENLLSNLTQSELQEVLEGSCDVLIPIPPFNGICKKLMDTFQDELNDMLVSRMDPTQVCTVSGLCWKPDNSDIEQRASEIFLRQSAKKTCNTCKASVTNMAAITKFAGKRDFIEGFSNACQGAGYSKAKCDEFAQTYFAKFLHHFQLAPSERTCQFLGRCDGPSRPMSVGPADTMECEFCEAMIHKVVVQFNNTSMKQQVKTVLENICKTTGSWAAECQQRIEDDFDKAYDELISMLNPVKACTLAGICNSKQSLRSLPMAKLTPARPATALGSAAMCTICQDVAKVVQKAVNANFTQNQLIGALDLVCDVLPTASKENCFDFVNKNVPQLIQMFNERFTVDHICSESFKFCPAATELRAEFREDKCHMCETAVSWVASELNSTRTEDDIIKLVQEVCDTDLIPPKSKSSCRSEIEAYGSLIIHLLVHRMDPGQICSEIRLCNAPRAVKPAAQVPDPVCDECQLIANHIVAALDDDRTERNIKNVLDKTCQMIPVDYGRCEQFINTNLDQLFEILRQKVTADEICKTLRLCASRVAVADAECVLCSQVVDYLIHKLKGNFSDAAALEAMEKVCKVLPVDQKQCQNYIDVYGGYILSMLERGFAADAVCAAIGLCDKPKPVDRAPEGVTCEECQKIAGYIVEAINDDRSEANIKAVLERTCEACPDVDGCRKFIDENVDTLFELLRQEVTVDRICKTVGLCGARNLPRPAVMKSGSTGCELCSDVVGYLIGELKDNTTDAAILDALQRVCEILPVDRAECQNVINVYGEYIISMIQQDATPNAICAAIGRCKLLKPIARAPADICEECQKIAGYIVMAINDDRSEANIKAVLDKTCESCPDMDGCRKFMDEHVDALFELLRQEVTVDRICKTLGLCAAPEPAARAPRHTCEECQKFAGYIVAAINDDHSEANIKAVLENTCEACPDKDGCRKFMDEHVDALFELLRQEVTVDGICKALKLCEAPKPAARAPGHTCEECQKVAGYIVAAINDDRSEANIKAVLENTCEACPDKDGCRKFMDEHVDALFELLRQEVTVDGICKALKLCGAQKPVVRAPGVVCEECQKIAGYIVAAVNDDRSQENIKAVLEKTCELCPDIDGCQQFIDTNLDQLFELLRTEVTVDHICKSLRLCGVRISTASATKSGTDRAPASDSCQLCQSIAGFVITELKDNKTQSAIVAALERGCAVLPVDQTQCKNIIDTYSSMIVSMIQNDLTPDEICGTLKFCSAPRPKGQSCELCETVAHFLVDELKDNKTAAAILDALERVCNVLPVDKVSCRNTIDTYGSIIMSLIQQDASADEICAAIGLCSTGKIARISGADSCNACKAITGFLIDELKDNQTDAAVIAALEKVCKVVPIDKTQCQNYIDVYGNMVIELIKNNLSADEICSTIGFCSTGEIQSSDSA